MARKLPIGIQSFESLRRDGYLYVDKTAYVYRLAHEGKPYFLSRPRRFGKSLLVSTMRAYFEGRRELFAGLDIECLEEGAAEREGREPWVARPVFHFDLTGQDYRTVLLEDTLAEQLSVWERAYGLSGDGRTLGFRFQTLLGCAHEQSDHRCVVLVDEYDKPLLDLMDDPALLERNRGILKGFFSVLKKADEHLRFVFLAGVTRFSKVSIFSDLNQLNDISLDTRYAALCGVTEDELLATFEPELDIMASQLGTDREGCLAALRDQYDGYCFHPEGPGAPEQVDGRKVYNPFSLLRALYEGRLGSYWFATGTPTFLARRMRDAGFNPKRLTDGTIYATERRLGDYRGDDPDPIPLMFQAGYLTIRDADSRTGRYTLAVPNREVEWGLVESLLPAYAPAYSEARGTDVFALLDLVEAGDTDGMRDVLAALFASIPYTQASDPFENYFQAIIWLVFELLGRYVRTEVRQARGRADVVVEAAAHVYVMELKRDGTAEEALAQIEERGYAAPFAADPRQVHLVGCAFDSRTRQLREWVVA